ncbi:hypothetical protein [Saccharicrinis fermentans]|uniref:Uncharacterized protein n=1 Tax=Saccharicrinis fermentans DSM 9555 = JCM 21142 TaxID=869213 RepID=W7YQU9_9BACT|nr:hypothetical protein [Saccharicrinis fermentans]GAF04809.1 hypothetical protein JCM21142_93527 [Saccharicrinis fermentans DSM 9555 = JCM 21142]
MEFYNVELSKDIKSLCVEDFDINIWYDANRIKNILKCLFFNNDTIFFSFRREEDLTSDKELERLRISIIETFNKYGEYVFLKKLDEARFDSVARIDVSDFTFEFMFDIWKYFYSCTFFIPTEGFSFSDYISFQKKIKFQDKGGEKLLSKRYSDFGCIKGLGGDSLIVSYRKDFQLPDLKKAASETPDINQVFK